MLAPTAPGGDHSHRPFPSPSWPAANGQKEMLGRELEEMEENYDWTFNFLHPFPLIVLFLDLALAKENKKINCEFAILIFSFASQIQEPTLAG